MSYTLQWNNIQQKIKRNEVLMEARIWMNLENIMEKKIMEKQQISSYLGLVV